MKNRKIIRKYNNNNSKKNIKTSLKTGFAQIFSCCPPKGGLPKIWGEGGPEYGCRATSLTLLTGNIKGSHAATVKKSYM